MLKWYVTLKLLTRSTGLFLTSIIYVICESFLFFFFFFFFSNPVRTTKSTGDLNRFARSWWKFSWNIEKSELLNRCFWHNEFILSSLMSSNHTSAIWLAIYLFIYLFIYFFFSRVNLLAGRARRIVLSHTECLRNIPPYMNQDKTSDTLFL